MSFGELIIAYRKGNQWAPFI